MLRQELVHGLLGGVAGPAVEGVSEKLDHEAVNQEGRKGPDEGCLDSPAGQAFPVQDGLYIRALIGASPRCWP